MARFVQCAVRCWAAAVCLVGASGCTPASTLETEPKPDPAPHTCDTGANLTVTPLFDFGQPSQAQFHYYANPNDPTGHTDVQPPGSNPDTSALIEVDRCPGTRWATAFAIHLVGGDYTSYGPNLSWQVGQSASTAIDLSAYSGIGFWAKTDAATPQTLTLVVEDTDTFPVEEDALRRCTPSSDTFTPPAGTSCYDGGRSSRNLSQDWHLYTIDFSELVEQTWGHQSPGGVPDIHRVMSMEFNLPVLDSFDVWMGQIFYFKR